MKKKRLSIKMKVAIVFLSLMTFNLIVFSGFLSYALINFADYPKELRARNYIDEQLYVYEVNIDGAHEATTLKASIVGDSSNTIQNFNIYRCNHILRCNDFYLDVKSGAIVDVLYYPLNEGRMITNPLIRIAYQGKDYVEKSDALNGVEYCSGFMNEDWVSPLLFMLALCVVLPITLVYMAIAIVLIKRDRYEKKIQALLQTSKYL